MPAIPVDARCHLFRAEKLQIAVGIIPDHVAESWVKKYEKEVATLG